MINHTIYTLTHTCNWAIGGFFYTDSNNNNTTDNGIKKQKYYFSIVCLVLPAFFFHICYYLSRKRIIVNKLNEYQGHTVPWWYLCISMCVYFGTLPSKELQNTIDEQ